MGRRRRRRKMRAQKAAQSKQVKSGVAKVKTAASAISAKKMKFSSIGSRVRGGSSKFASRKKANTMRSKTGKYSEASKHAKHVQGRTSDNVKQHGATLKGNNAKNYQSSKLIKG